MAINTIVLQASGIKKALKDFTTYDAIAQYIWNGFDADASVVKVNFMYNALGGINGLQIIDNGYGINKDELPIKFKKIFESSKTTSKIQKKNSSDTHGKDGVGRFSFFTFANAAFWETVYKHNNMRYMYTITINANSLEQYEDTDIEETEFPCGTKVVFLGFNDNKFSMLECKEFLMIEFAWFLELNINKSYAIIVDDQILDYSSVLAEKHEETYKMENSDIDFKVKFCRWDKKLHNEYSKYYYINSKGNEEYKETTTLNKKGDKFYHSVFIKSAIFDDFRYKKDEGGQLTLNKYSRESNEYRFLKKNVDNFLKNLRSPFVKEYTQHYIKELKAKGVYPSIDKNNILDKHREEILDDMIQAIYVAEPKIFSNLNLTQQKTLIRLFDMSMQAGSADSLYNVLEDVLDMDTEERDELADLLKYTSMSNITKTIALIKDRLLAINDLKQLVFNKALSTKEVPHLQKFIEKHYWLFGEQYHLVTAEEPDFEEALRRFLYILRGDATETGRMKKVQIDNPDKEKEMDIFAVQRLLDGSVKKSVVVELKHPSITLGSKELGQVKTFFQVIDKENRFNSNEIQWVFYLVGNSFDSNISDEIETNKSHGEPSLVFKVRNKKIFVKTWSDIFTEHEINYHHLQEKLLLEKETLLKLSVAESPSEIVDRQEKNTAVRPSEFNQND